MGYPWLQGQKKYILGHHGVMDMVSAYQQGGHKFDPNNGSVL